MTKITQGATVVEFKYDGLKRRAQRIAGGVTRDFKYANDQIMVEKEGATIVAEYMLARGMIFREAGGAKETYHFDWIGSARALTDGAQVVVATNNYEAFGSVIGSTGSSGNTYKFDGEWRYRDDGDFGLLHVGARYYEPGTGRFVAADVDLGNTAQPETLNRYVYAGNNPVNNVDASGRGWRDVFRKAVGAIMIVGGAVIVLGSSPVTLTAFGGFALVAGIGVILIAI